ncbi:hypothetical protein ACRAWF_42730 [Streptomyces sp. L7]
MKPPSRSGTAYLLFSTRTTSGSVLVPGVPPSGTTPTSSTPARRSCPVPSCGGCTREGLNLDVCSGGELRHRPLRRGMPADRIAFHGNNKSVSEITRAIEAGVRRIVLDSFQEIVRVAHIAQSLGKRQRVQIRITVGVEAHTHEIHRHRP